jgi:hypothetical protein
MKELYRNENSDSVLASSQNRGVDRGSLAVSLVDFMTASSANQALAQVAQATA